MAEPVTEEMLAAFLLRVAEMVDRQDGQVGIGLEILRAAAVETGDPFALVAEVRRLRAAVRAHIPRTPMTDTDYHLEESRLRMVAEGSGITTEWRIVNSLDALAFAARSNGIEAREAELARTLLLELSAKLRQAHAAGYARAERDVVAFVRRAAETHRDAAEFAGVAAEGVLVDAEALDLVATGIEQGAHRGAAKDEAPRGEEDGR